MAAESVTTNFPNFPMIKVITTIQKSEDGIIDVHVDIEFIQKDGTRFRCSNEDEVDKHGDPDEVVIAAEIIRLLYYKMKVDQTLEGGEIKVVPRPSKDSN